MARDWRTPSHEDYYPFPESTIKREAQEIQQYINNHRRAGIPIISADVWHWIKQKRPEWPELERERVYKMVRL